MRRTVPVVALALLMVLAGCSLPGTSSGPSPTPDPDEVERPPGVQDGRLADGKKLLNAHNRSAVASGFESDFRVNGTTTYNGSVIELQRRQQTRVESGATEYQYRVVNGGEGPNARFDYWGNRTKLAIRAQSNGDAQYGTGKATSPRELANVLTLGTYVLASNYTVTSVDRTNGTVLFTLETDSIEGIDLLLPENATNASNYRAVLIVDGQGRVHEFAATADYTIDGEPGSIEIRYLLVQVGGIDVKRPDWVSKAFDEG